MTDTMITLFKETDELFAAKDIEAANKAMSKLLRYVSTRKFQKTPDANRKAFGVGRYLFNQHGAIVDLEAVGYKVWRKFSKTHVTYVLEASEKQGKRDEEFVAHLLKKA